jgi:hypothetical protein
MTFQSQGDWPPEDPTKRYASADDVPPMRPIVMRMLLGFGVILAIAVLRPLGIL